MNANRLTVVTPPDGDAFDLDLMKSHLNIDFSDDDDLISAYMAAAVDLIEGQGITLLSRTYRLSLDLFPCDGITLPAGPTTEVVEITYRDPAGEWRTLDPVAYEVTLERTRALIVPPFSAYWPLTIPRPGAVRVDFVAGYATAEAIPAGLRAAAQLLVGNWYRNREAIIAERSVTPAALPMGVDALLSRYREIPFS